MAPPKGMFALLAAVPTRRNELLFIPSLPDRSREKGRTCNSVRGSGGRWIIGSTALKENFQPARQYLLQLIANSQRRAQLCRPSCRMAKQEVWEHKKRQFRM